jgi:hypothetical protein
MFQDKAYQYTRVVSEKPLVLFSQNVFWRFIYWPGRGKSTGIFRWMIFPSWRGQSPLVWLPASGLQSAGTQEKGGAAPPEMGWSSEGSPGGM